MKKQILAIPRRAAPVACFVILLLAQNQDLSAQRAKRKDKTRIYTIDLSQSRVTATLTQEGFIARRYPTHRVEVKNFSGKIKIVSVSVSDARKSGETRAFTLNGDLTLREATKRVSFPVTVTISKDQLRATGDAELKQTDFGITPYSGKLGMIRIGDEVKINFAIVAKSP